MPRVCGPRGCRRLDQYVATLSPSSTRRPASVSLVDWPIRRTRQSRTLLAAAELPKFAVVIWMDTVENPPAVLDRVTLPVCSGPIRDAPLPLVALTKSRC